MCSLISFQMTLTSEYMCCFNFTEDNIIETPEKSDDVNYNLTNYVKFSLLLNTIMIVWLKTLSYSLRGTAGHVQVWVPLLRQRRLRHIYDDWVSLLSQFYKLPAAIVYAMKLEETTFYLLYSSVLNLRIRPLYKHRLLTVLGRL